MSRRRSTVAVPGPQARGRRADGPALSAALEERAPLLAAGALSGGLARLRPRSSPARLAFEARQFVLLLAQALRTSGDLPAVRPAVRMGPFACAESAEVQPLFAVWRRALQASLVAYHGRSAAVPLDAALRRLEVAVTQELKGWASERIDVIALGASAGGVGALETVMGGIEAVSPASFLVVMHVNPKTPSFLPAVLARRCRVAVTSAVDGGTLLLGHAFVAPPGAHLTVDGAVLRLVGGPEVRYVKPSVDVLFESAAKAFGPRLASVVLSGTGVDGAAGTRRVRERGGVTMAEEPTSADFNGMPRAAVETGDVEHVLPLRLIGSALQALVRQGRRGLRH